MKNPNQNRYDRIRHILALAQVILGLVLLILEIFERIKHFL